MTTKPIRQYRAAQLTEIPSLRVPSVSEAEWKPVRHHLGVGAFGVNAFTAAGAGETLVSEHDERAAEGSETQEHEELYFVIAGHASFTLDGETVEATAGTFVFVSPSVVRSAIARVAGTTVLAVGAPAGQAFEVSAWERKHTGTAG